MTERAIIWPLAGATSVAAHILLLAGLMLTLRPDKLPQQQMPQARIDIAPHQVERIDAVETAAHGEMAVASSAEKTAVSGAAIAVSRAKALDPGSDPVTAANADAAMAASIPAAGQVIQPVATRGDAVAAASVDERVLTPLVPIGGAVAGISAAIPAAATAETVAPAIAVGTQLATTAAQGTVLAALKTQAPALPDSPTAAIATPASRLPPPAEFATAALAWSGSSSDTVDPFSLAAVQAFMRPSNLADSRSGADSLRDGIAATLSGVPCARLQTIFQPETGMLELRGHVPEEALRAPVMAALQAHIGSAIPITDRLLVLPRPQCQALSGIAAVGLAQSTEQATNPRVVGSDAFVRDYSYSAGQRLVLDLQAPDYASFIYVDYFDAQGNVLHIQPNQTIPPEIVAPKTVLAIGQDRQDAPSINLTISPPFGQEIAVAFAVSTPLYDGLRPLIEPAAPYLDFLRDRVAVRRSEFTDFKGEWVYFFITTSAE